jgi:integrase
MKVNWNEPELVKWVGNITRKATQYTYKSSFRIYAEFTGMTAKELIDEAIEDSKRDVRERQDVVKTKLLNFYRWLKEEYPRKSRGKGLHKIVGKGVSDSAANTFVMAIRSFYATYDINVKLKGRQRLPKPKVENKRMNLTTADVKLLVDHARSPRDRAIILTTFQGGMDVSTLCSINYRDVARGLEANEHPLKLELFRQKRGIDYYTFLGRDAIEAIKAYVNDLKAKGVVLENGMPLFLKQSIKAKKLQALEPNLIQNMLKKIAVASGLVDSNMNGNVFNPISPHTLRESFGSIMVNKGVPDSIVDFWLGHEVGAMSDAYKRGRFEELKQMYSEKESFISIVAPAANFLEVQEMKKTVENLNLQKDLKIARLENKLASLESAVEEIKEFQKGMKHYQQGGLVVTYHRSTGFLPGELEEFSDDILVQQKKDLEKEAEEITRLLNQRKAT